MDNFLPEGYNLPESNGNYLKFSQGETRFRIISNPITGYVVWVDEAGSRKPLRYRSAPAVMPDNSDGKAKHFWAFATLYNGEVGICESNSKFDL